MEYSNEAHICTTEYGALISATVGDLAEEIAIEPGR